jgi:putative membrane protein
MRPAFILPAVAMLVAAGAATAGAAPAAADNGKVSALDRAFVAGAGHAGAFEVAAGRLAAQQAHHEGVRAFGNRMVGDHTKAGKELQTIAAALGLEVPDGPDKPQQAILTLLGTTTGPAFDCAYAPTEYVDHVAAIGLFERQAEDGRNGRLRTFARKALPLLREHRDMIADALPEVRCTAPVPLPTPIPVPGD